MNKIYGYCRISTKKQSIERQVRNIAEAYPDAIIIRETFTGRKLNGRTEFNKLLKTVTTGDTLVFDSVSRMSRNADEGFSLYQKLYENGVELVFLKEPQINSKTYKDSINAKLVQTDIATSDTDTNNLINSIFKAINEYIMALAQKQILLAFEQAQKEVDDLSQRTSEGIQTARLNGKQIGQKTGAKLNVKKKEPVKTAIKKHCKDFGGSLSDAEVLAICGVSRNTFYKYKKEVRAELQETE